MDSALLSQRMASKQPRQDGGSEDMPDVVESIARSVECPVCKSCYEGGEHSKIPKLLPCLHTVCSHCIQSMAGSSSSCKCPICQKPVPEDAADLPTNFIALEVAETLSLKSGTPKCCSLCDDGEASHFCSKCSTYMCGACQESHSRQKLTKDHKVLTMEQARDQISRVVSLRSKMCDSHPTEIKDIFCVKCQALACHKCILLSHSQAKGHEFESLDVAYGKAKEEVKASMAESEDCEKTLQGHLNEVLSVKDSLDSNADKAEEELVEAFRGFADLLEARKEELLDELRNFKSAKMKALATEEDELGMALLKSRTVREFAQEALEQECNVHLLSLKQGIVEGFKDVVEAGKTYRGPCETEELCFMSRDELVRGYIGSIGSISASSKKGTLGVLEAGPNVIVDSSGAQGSFLSVKVYDGMVYALRTNNQDQHTHNKIEVYRGTGQLVSVFEFPGFFNPQRDQSLDRFAVALDSIFYVQDSSLRKFKLPAAGGQVGSCEWTVDTSRANGVAGGFANDVAVLSGQGVKEGRVFLSEVQTKAIRILDVASGQELSHIDLRNVGYSMPISITVHSALDEARNVWEDRLFVSCVAQGRERYAARPGSYPQKSIFSLLMLDCGTYESSDPSLLAQYSAPPGTCAPTNLTADEKGSLLFTSHHNYSIQKAFQGGAAVQGPQAATSSLYPQYFSQQLPLSGLAADADGNLVCCNENQIIVRRRT